MENFYFNPLDARAPVSGTTCFYLLYIFYAKGPGIEPNIYIYIFAEGYFSFFFF